ncbi:MAG: sodium-dependent transporter [Halobacteriaceae archaeon]
MSERESWATRIGFILAAVGSAVGLGNVWRFPYVTAENGGAAFLVVYLLAVLVVGLPAMLAEFSIGRRGQRNIVDVYERVGHPTWRFAGALGVLTGFWILSYYSVVGGWVLRYIFGSATGAYFGDPGGYFTAVSAGPEAVLFHFLFMAVTVGIVAFGIEQGIEWSAKLMVPSIVLLMVILAVWAATLGGASAGYDFYLSPDVSTIVDNIGTVAPAAVGQALFSLSLGMGVMVTYASYLGRDDNLGFDGLSIALLNTFVGVLAGFVVFPLLAAQGVEYGDAGAGAIFISMATAFQQVPFGRLVGVIFFAIVGLAALSSAISLLEVVVSYFVDNTAHPRRLVTAAIGGVIFLLGIPSAWSNATLGQFDTVASNVLLPLGTALVVIFVGWVYAADALDEIRQGTDGAERLGPAWLWLVRTVVLFAVVATLALRLASFVGL